MLQTLRNAWKIPELRKKIIFTLFILLIYRVGNVIPVPFIDVATLANYYDSVLSSTILGLYNAMSGSAFSQATVFALGIQPYINASIIIQLLTIAIPALERLAKEGGEEGQKKIARISRYTTVGLGLLMGWAYYTMLHNYSSSSFSIITQEGFLPALVIILAFTAGSTVVMWLGEQITEFGIGNGISMILFANIVSGLPRMVGNLIAMSWWQILIVLVGMIALILFIIFINDAERRIPIQYAKRVVGRKVYGGQNTNLPIKVSMAGVMPIIFAQSICSLPATVCAFTGHTSGWWYENVWSSSSWTYAVIYFLMIFFFSWFYSTIQYDPVEQNLGLWCCVSGRCGPAAHCRRQPDGRCPEPGDRRYFHHHHRGRCARDGEGAGSTDAHAALQRLPGLSQEVWQDESHSTGRARRRKGNTG